MDENKLLNYKYIYNTLEKPSTVSSDSILKVGSKVKNLLVELSDETVWNFNFQEYYGDKKPIPCWEPYKTKKIKYSDEVSNDTTGDNITITTKPRPTPYKTKLKYVLDVSSLLGENAFISEISAKNITKAKQDAIYEYDINNKTITFYFYSDSSEVKGSFSFFITTPDSSISVAEAEKKAIQLGRLYSSVEVKPNTSYMLQVANSVFPSNILNGGDHNSVTIISVDSSGNESKKSVMFYDCAFFKTGPNAKYVELSIYGLSYSCKIYGQNGDRIYEMRSFKTDNKPKIFLFETDLPWAVDNNGIITHLENIKLNVQDMGTESAIDASLDKDQIKNLFKTAPELVISDTDPNDKPKILIPLPNSILDSDGFYNWKLQNLWKYIGTKDSYPNIMDNIYLLVYRNFLTDENRDYNDVQITTQYGLLRTIQRTTINDKDTYNKNGLYKLQINPIHLSDIAPSSDVWEFYPIAIEPFNTKIDYNDRVDINLNILSLLGFNYSYSVKNGKHDIYKYTSISFAWGVKNGSEFERISEYSIPLIIDRSICTINPDSNEVEAVNYTLKKDPTDNNYYTKPAIFMDKVVTNQE